MIRTKRMMGLAVAIAGLVGGCATAPSTPRGKQSLELSAIDTLQRIEAKDPGVRQLIDQSAGYVVFPGISQGGFVVGGAGGEGVVFERGRAVGYATLSQASVGAQAGGQRYAELIVVRDRFTLDQMRAGKFNFGGQASAVAVRAGAGAETQFGENGVAVFVDPLGGAMINVSLSGQRIKFTS